MGKYLETKNDEEAIEELSDVLEVIHSLCWFYNSFIANKKRRPYWIWNCTRSRCYRGI